MASKKIQKNYEKQYVMTFLFYSVYRLLIAVNMIYD